MASRSFTFKQPTNSSVGSFLQQEPALLFGGDDDSALRGDNYVTFPDETVSGDTELLLDVSPTSYSSVQIRWQITSSLSASASLVPSPTRVLIVYSPSGYPQTVSSGEILVESRSTGGVYDHDGLLPGKWAYYSMFVLYETTDTQLRSWYERIGSVEVLVPTDYGSTDDLWKRIPRHYRLQDQLLASDPDDVDSYGPLKRALSVFGWDIDRIRSLIDYQMVAKDPNVAEVESLDALSYELGLPLSTIDLGPSRLRNLLNNARINNTIKGTLNGVEQVLSSVVGSTVEITPTRPERLTASQRNFSSIVTSSPPTGNQWSYTVTPNVTVSAVGSALSLQRASGSNYVFTVVSTPVTISQASRYRTFYDVTTINGASVVGSYMSTTHASASAWTIDTPTGFISDGPVGWVRQSSGTDTWYQAPQDHGVIGDGTFTTATAYLHIVVVFGPGATGVRLQNPSVIALDNYPYTIDVYSERANLVRDPRFSTTINNATSASSGYWNWSYGGGSTGASVTSGSSSLTITATGLPVNAPAVPDVLTEATLWIDASDPPQVTINTNTTNNNIPVRVGIEYNFSVIDSSRSITYVALVSRTYGRIAMSETPYAEVSTADGPRRYWMLFREYEEPWLPLDVSDCYLEFGCLPRVTTTRLIRPLFEHLVRSGSYFDGDSINGGWLRGDNYSGTADFRWGDNGVTASFSYYATDYLRMREAVLRLIPYIVPATETNATVRFNRLFGQTTSGMP